MDSIDPDENTSKLVEQLLQEAAQKRRRLSVLNLRAKQSSANDESLTSEIGLPRLALETVLDEKNESQYKVRDLLKFDDRQFLHNAYRAILKRPADPEGFSYALEGLRQGRFHKIDVLAQLSRSEEGRAKGVLITGLRRRAMISRICRLPVIKHLIAPIISLMRWAANMRPSSIERVLNRQYLIADYVNQNLSGLQELPLLLQEQKKTQALIKERADELTKFLEDRITAEGLQRRREFDDRTAEIEDLRRVYNKYRTQVELVEKDLKREMAHIFQKQQEVRTELVFQSRRLEKLLDNGTPASLLGSTSENTGTGIPAQEHNLDAFFATFDEHFRGSREDVKKRLRAYLPVIRECGAGTPEAPILDVGCGRGEWLELLKEHDLSAFGVDSNSVLVDQCRKRGLEVIQTDFAKYLRRVPAGSLGAVTAFHLVEHLPIESLVLLLDETVRVLRSGGLVLLETPNPHNVLVGSCNFYFDPTHRNPLPSPVLEFLVESRGFVRVETVELNPSDEKPLPGELEVERRFNQYFYGPMDYAVIARKV